MMSKKSLELFVVMSFCLLYSFDCFAQLSQPDGTLIPQKNSLRNILNNATYNEGIDVRADASLVPEVFIPSQTLTFTMVAEGGGYENAFGWYNFCLLYTSPSPRDATLSRMPSSA